MLRSDFYGRVLLLLAVGESSDNFCVGRGSDFFTTAA